MRPESIDVELTGHKNLVLSDSFRLDYVTVNSVAVLNEKVRNLLINSKYPKIFEFKIIKIF